MNFKLLFFLKVIVLSIISINSGFADESKKSEKRLFKCLIETMESRRHNQESIDKLSQIVDRAERKIMPDNQLELDCLQNLKKMRSQKKVSHSKIANMFSESYKKYKISGSIYGLIDSKSCVIVGFKTGGVLALGLGFGGGGGICKTNLGRKLFVAEGSFATGWGLGTWVALTLDNDEDLYNNSPDNNYYVFGLGPAVMSDQDSDKIKGIGIGAGLADINYGRGIIKLLNLGMDYTPIRNLLNR